MYDFFSLKEERCDEEVKVWTHLMVETKHEYWMRTWDYLTGLCDDWNGKL